MAEHGIPAVERAIEVMDALARQPGASIRDLANTLPIPRSTIYRILKSLEDYDVALRTPDGGFELGPRLVRLARSVRSGSDIVSIAKPIMDELARSLDCGVKLSVLDADAALVVAVAESPQTYSVTTQVGRRFPLHAGAASKVLLAFSPDMIRQQAMAAPLLRYTATTIVDPLTLSRVVEEVRRVGNAKDEGEFVPGVFAIARPVFDQSGQCVAALSIPFLEATPADVVDRFAGGLARAAEAITRRLGGPAPPPGPA